MSELNAIEEIMPQLQNEKIDVIAATSVLHAKVDAIRKEKINWQSYLETSMISEEDFRIITRLDILSEADKSSFFNEHKLECTRTFFRLLTHIPKEQTIQYVLVIVNDLLQEEKLRTDVFHEYAKTTDESGWTPFLNLLNRDDHFITNMAARILTKMACSGGANTIESSDLNFFLTWLKDQLLVEDYEYMQSVTRCLQMMLRHNAYRQAFMKIDGVSVLMTVLTRKINFQVEYQIIYCLWVLTFSEEIVEVINKYRVVPVLSDILSDSGKEKVNRITLAVLRNLIEKCPDTKIAREHCMAMIQSKITKQLGLLEQKKYDDEDIVENIAYLLEKLQTTMQDLSSFEEYSTEVKSGRLEWSPVHKSNFWRENAQRLNENNNELLRILIGLLQKSQSPVILCVACFDIGEYVRHYPRGKRIIEQLGGKQAVMQLLTHDDLNVRYEALLAVQKIMVHHWESFGKQLEREKGNGSASSSTAAGSAATVSVR